MGVSRQIPRRLRKVNISLVVHPQDVIAGAVVMLGKQLLKLFGRWRSVQVHRLSPCGPQTTLTQKHVPLILTESFPHRQFSSCFPGAWPRLQCDEGPFATRLLFPPLRRGNIPRSGALSFVRTRPHPFFTGLLR